jgi:hypothetical protein
MNIRVKALFIIAAVAYIISSCKKNDDAPLVTSTANLNVVNASSDTINFYLNGIRLNNTTSFYPGGSLGYVFAVTSGTQNYQFKRAGSPNTLFTKSLTLGANNNYSLYVAGQTANDAFMTQDVLTADTSGNALVRFVNASPDSSPLVINIAGIPITTGTTLDTITFTGVAYQTTTSFKTVKGGYTYNLSVYQASSPSKPKSDTTATLNAGQIYTIYSYGLVSTAGNEGLSTSLIVNK